MRPFCLMIIASLGWALSLDASILEVRSFDRSGKTIEVEASGASMHAFIRVIELRTGLTIRPDFEDFRFDAEIRGVRPLDALFQVTRRFDLLIEREGMALVIRDEGEWRVTLDVSEAEAEEVVEKVARECGFRNVWIPGEIGRRATFRFDQVPCSIAMRTIFDSLGLQGIGERNGVLLVETRK